MPDTSVGWLPLSVVCEMRLSDSCTHADPQILKDHHTPLRSKGRRISHTANRAPLPRPIAPPFKSVAQVGVDENQDYDGASIYDGGGFGNVASPKPEPCLHSRRPVSVERAQISTRFERSVC